MIIIRYSSIDGFAKSLECETPDVARHFAQHRVGAHPEIGNGYAVSPDGVIRVTVKGCTLAELFAERVIPMPIRVEGYNVRFWDGRISDTSWQVLVDHLYPRGPNHQTREEALAWAKAEFPDADIKDDGHVRTIWAD